MRAFPFPGGFKGAAGTPETWANTKEFLTVVIPIETGLLGTVLGYFFGKKQDE